jgi:PIN domain nuclease of toxin-antitoxin system
MSDLVIDTHIIIWALTEPYLLSVDAKVALVAAEANGIILISSVTLIELAYLTEKGKVAAQALTLVREALDDLTTAYRL